MAPSKIISEQIVAFKIANHMSFYNISRYQWQTALSYIAIILSCYFVGMGLLLLHYINQRSITLYDFYLEAYLWCKTPSPDSRGGSSGGGDSSCSRQNSQSQQGGEEGLVGISSSQQGNYNV